MNTSDLSILVSIIVPVYKAERFLEKCVNSILNQTYSHFELILVNDGSPDNSSVLCDKYAKSDARVIVKHTENQGVSAARNEGLLLARGEYIVFVDSDDWIEPGFLAAGLHRIVSHNADLYISGLVEETFRNNELVSSVLHEGKNKLYSIKELFDAFNVEYPFFLICGPTCKLYRRDIIQQNNIHFDVKTTFGEDMLFNCDYLQRANKVAFSSEVFYHYFRGNPDSLFSRYYPDMYEINIPLYERMLSLMRDVKCDGNAIRRMEGIYTRVLVGCIYHEFAFCDHSTKASRQTVINKVSKNLYVKRCPISNYSHPKDIILILLLKLGATGIVHFLFTRHYCK